MSGWPRTRLVGMNLKWICFFLQNTYFALLLWIKHCFTKIKFCTSPVIWLLPREIKMKPKYHDKKPGLPAQHFHQSRSSVFLLPLPSLHSLWFQRTTLQGALELNPTVLQKTSNQSKLCPFHVIIKVDIFKVTFIQSWWCTLQIFLLY